MNYSPFLHLILLPQKKEKTVHHFHMTIMHLVYPPRLCITIVFNFSWNDCNNQEKLETMVRQNSGGKQGALWSMWKWWIVLTLCSIFLGKLNIMSIQFTTFTFNMEWVKNRPRNKFKKQEKISTRAKKHFPSLSILRHSPLSESLEQGTTNQEKLKTIAIQNCLEGVG